MKMARELKVKDHQEMQVDLWDVQAEPSASDNQVLKQKRLKN